MSGISKAKHRLFQIQISCISGWVDSSTTWYAVTRSYVEIDGEGVLSDTNTRRYVPRLAKQPGTWHLHMRNGVLVLTTDYVDDPLITGVWADVYPAYQRYARMLTVSS
jgi:hypothetical protein